MANDKSPHKPGSAMILDGKEKERLHTLMRKTESFCGVQVLTYTILDNHFHILLFVPERRPVSDDELITRMAETARAGLTEVMMSKDVTTGWNDASCRYRELLYVTGQARGVNELGKPLRPGFDPKVVQEVLDAGGEVTLPELLRCRVRYFTDGAVLGSKVYVEDAFQRHRAWFSAKRKTGARPMRGGFPELFTVRRLQLNVITAPATG
jgi:hypothetical protein